ncbi:MAG: hypothetical protein IJB53_03575, partial [Mailhella sp.]|nr:hypothetical protein [Mailhella sp.]
WCCLAELGTLSMDNNCAAVTFPDFTRGRGDESSASGDGVHKACKEEENAQNQKYAQRDFHGMSCSFRRYGKAAPSF